jgi:hypothetical protein
MDARTIPFPAPRAAVAEAAIEHPSTYTYAGIDRTQRRRTAFLAAAALAAAGLSAACGRETTVATDGGPAQMRQPAMPTQAPTGTQTQVPNIPPNVPADVQVLPITIANGELDSDRYVVQAGPVRLHVKAGAGGPYSMRIDDGLLQARVVRENDTTAIDLNALPGRYTIKVNAGREDTALLEVQPPGGVPGTTPR